MRVLALVVVYGADPLKTTSLCTLLATDFPRSNLRILVWDNSPSPLNNIAPLTDAGVAYRSTPENLGLSVIYNHVIKTDLQDGEHLLLLDQDTTLPTNFLARCDAAVRQHPDIALFLPMIRANSNWVSPLSYALGWGRYWPAPKAGRMSSRKICAINSGMLISSTYLKEACPGYDERLRFYGTDTQFMLDYMDRCAELVVLDLHLEHDLSFFSDSVQNRAEKFNTMRAAYRYIYEGRPIWQRFGVAMVMQLVSITYAVRYRELAFLRLLS
ncbi:hypothetical protein [Roseateles koreensis]|uniref:Glycosyltransferase, GT2 family n=1 Tax=Roseateles koreensis TaxID=2987526 RepID=A0ABT5KNS7_9BURK|nr:hypothetical protein [Roseateles koreensis]MDC8784105.1 hypothetical protein [Roseateles koreensis]